MSRDSSQIAYATAARNLILLRANGKRFTDPTALRRWIMLTFGVRSEGEPRPPDDPGELRVNPYGDYTIIFDSAAPARRQVRIILHELAEYVIRCLLPGIPGLTDAASTVAAFKPDVLDRLHKISRKTENLLADDWSIDYEPSSLSDWKNRLYLHKSANEIYYSRPRVEIEPADPFDDGSCI